MKLTISEALRLKNEVSSVVSRLSKHLKTKDRYTFDEDKLDISYGVTCENNEKVSVEDSISFLEYEEKLTKALIVNFTLNDAISSFNNSKNLTSLVRERQNSLLLIKVYNLALEKAKESKSSKFEVVGEKREKIEVTYTPYVSSFELKDKIKKLRKRIRELQKEIDRANTTIINVEINEEDLDMLGL